MKKTGIIRRIDNLGRIVIPKEIRSTLRIKNGDNLEIYLDDDENIIFKKFSIIDKLTDLSEIITSSINLLTKTTAIITNNDKIISISGKYKKELENQNISNEISDMVDVHIGKDIKLSEEKGYADYYLIIPLILSGDKIGNLIILSENEITEEEKTISKITTAFLIKYVE